GPLQDRARRRGRRPRHPRLPLAKLRHDLARSPARPLLPQADNRLRHSRRRRSTMLMGCTGALRQPRRTRLAIAPKPFVAGLATDRVALAKLRHRPQTAHQIPDETNPLVHRAALLPRHRPVLPADRELSPTFPVRSVTNLSGLDSGLLLPFAGE